MKKMSIIRNLMTENTHVDTQFLFNSSNIVLDGECVCSHEHNMYCADRHA